MYVYDLLTGSDNLSEAGRLQTEIIDILGKGVFALHKWCANHTDLLGKVYQNSYKNLNFLVILKTMKVRKLWDSCGIPRTIHLNMR
jgi:hypothetical protein